MKKIYFGNIDSNEVFPILIKWENNLYYTGYYYDENGNDCVFYSDNSVVAFKTNEELIRFCAKNNLKLHNSIVEYDFDLMPTNPIDYRATLDKWNILDTISSNLNITFDGKEKKYTDIYHFLFSCNFAIEPLPSLYKIPNDYFQLINNVFNKQSKILEKIQYFNDK